MAHGKTKEVKNHQVLVVKPKPGLPRGDSQPTTSTIGEVLASVPVERCEEKKDSGVLVVKLPTEAAKSEASVALKTHFGADSNYVVSEPKKMLPKMTLAGISSSMPDDEIISSILNKNQKIKSLIDGGCILHLLFTNTKPGAHTKSAVVKLSPEVRSSIVDGGSCIYVGLTRCPAYDRFWVKQCYHCQGFGHINKDCPKKDDQPKCSYCAGNHNSRDCTNKNFPRCVNCVGSSVQGGSVAHFASSVHCPMMMSQRNRIIENTNFVHSKN